MMKALSQRFEGFVTTCFLFWCVLNEVGSVPLDFDLSFPSTDFNDKPPIPFDFGQDYESVTEDILTDIENHYDESEIGIHSSEDATHLDDDFKNQTFARNELVQNDTNTKSYRLTNDKLNQIQARNDTDYLTRVNDTSQTRQSSILKQGKTKDTNDYYKDGVRFKNLTLQTSDDRIETSEIDQALRREEHLANVSSTGDFRYEARNDSDTESKEVSSHYAKSGRHVTDEGAKKENDFQGAHFTRTKTIHQANDRRTNSEKEQFIKSGSKDYIKEGASGLETLQKKCLNHLRQENQYKDQDKEIRRMRKRKNRKRTFLKRMGDTGPKSTWPNWDDFPEDCKDLLQEEIKIQNLPSEGKHRNDKVFVPDTGRSFDSDINVENNMKSTSTLPTPTPSSHDDDTTHTVNVSRTETTTATSPPLGSRSERKEAAPTEETNRSLPELSDTSLADLKALREKFNLIQKYIAKGEECDENKYGFAERLKPLNQTKTKSNFTSRRANTDPEIIFQDKNITNQTIECIEGEVNCTQDYYEYYYVEENVYGDDDYPGGESSPGERPLTHNTTARQYKGTNTMKKKTTHKKHSPPVPNLKKTKINPKRKPISLIHSKD